MFNFMDEQNLTLAMPDQEQSTTDDDDDSGGSV